jgi:membrane-associated phospholipid phosphatase
MARPSVHSGDPGNGQAPAEGGGLHAFLRDVWSDYGSFISIENAEWAAVGGTATLVAHMGDDMLRSATEGPTPMVLKPGSSYGNPSFQFPLAITWWIVGHAAHSSRGAQAGRDLVRAQISAASWTYAIKYAVDRTRPNGDPRSFPSGHSSATFATAMVLQEHYGWKLGVPVFAAAAYTASERITENKPSTSDVVFGALVGVLAGRTVTLRLREHSIQIEPQAMAGGGRVTIRVLQ